MTRYGIVIGRFQVPELSYGQAELLHTVQKDFDALVVFIGVAPKVDARNPLDYYLRRDMVLETFPHAIVHPLFDKPGDDAAWSTNLDFLIQVYAPELTLCGGRDSFIPHYKGQFKTKEYPEFRNIGLSGTQLRASVKPVSTKDFRSGVIHAVCSILPDLSMGTVTTCPHGLRLDKPCRSCQNMLDPRENKLKGWTDNGV